MAFKFEQLNVWHKAVELSNKFNILARGFPPFERYNLTRQVKKAADSVVLNIAEGSTGQTNLEFKRFLRIALRLGIEDVACLYLAFTRKYVLIEEYEGLYSEYEVLCKMITGLMRSI